MVSLQRVVRYRSSCVVAASCFLLACSTLWGQSTAASGSATKSGLTPDPIAQLQKNLKDTAAMPPLPRPDNAPFLSGANESSLLTPQMQQRLQLRDRLIRLNWQKLHDAHPDTPKKFDYSLKPQQQALMEKARTRATADSTASGSLLKPITVPQALEFTSASYADNMYVVWGTLTAPSDAVAVAVNFSSLDLETGHDFVYVEDALGNVCEALTGSFGQPTSSSWCVGNVAQVVIFTDASHSGTAGHTGFEISGYQYIASAGALPATTTAVAK